MKVLLRHEMWLYCFILLFSVYQSQELDESEGGHFLFLSENDELVEDVHLPGKGKAKPECEDSVLTSYLVSLQIINPESVIALAMKNKLENKCHNISKTIEHMEKYMKTCNVLPEQEQHVHLMNGVKVLHKKLCTKDPYHKKFMKNKNCYGQLQTEVADSCNGPADWCDSSEGKHVCRAYQEIRDCYYIKASVLCGNDAADIFKELVQCIIESVITVNCTQIASEEEATKMSAWQLALQRQRRLQTKSNHEGGTASVRVSGLPQLLTVITTIYLAKLIEWILQNRATAGEYS